MSPTQFTSQPRPVFQSTAGDIQLALYADRLAVSAHTTSWTVPYSPEIERAGRRVAYVEITAAMLEEATRYVSLTKMARTSATPHDTILGHIGEIVWAEFSRGDYRLHRIGQNFGEPDAGDVEVKISAVDYSPRCNLKIRRDYLKKSARIFVQMFLEGGAPLSAPQVGQRVIIAGFVHASEVLQLGRPTTETYDGGTYETWSVPARHLRPINQIVPAPLSPGSPQDSSAEPSTTSACTMRTRIAGIQNLGARKTV